MTSLLNPDDPYSLDELFEVAKKYGRLTTEEGFMGNKAEIKRTFTDDDYLCIRHTSPNTKRNIIEVINKCMVLKSIYKLQGWK